MEGRPPKRAGDGDTLLLAAGELRRIVADAVRHPHAFERFHHPFLALRRRHSLPVGKRQLDVFVHRQIANQVETLEDETNLLIADARALGKVQVFDRLVVQAIFPPGRSIQQPDDREQR